MELFVNPRSQSLHGSIPWCGENVARRKQIVFTKVRLENIENLDGRATQTFCDVSSVVPAHTLF